ncbi:hypothetical protein DITRI_Ditri12bG0031600 [Diplodiscus trichospermus]
MAEECAATSAVISSSSAILRNWWDFHPANSLSSWSASTTTWHRHLHHHPHQNPNSNTSNNCDQDDVVSISTSLTNASNHSALTVESSGGGGRQLVDQPAVPPDHPSNELIGEHASDNHLWNHVLSSVGRDGDVGNGQDVGENLFEAISSTKSISSTGIFEPACDYLKKIEGNWDFQSTSGFNNFIKNFNGYDTSTDHDHQSSVESERLTRMSNLVSNWSINPPDPHVNPQFINSVENYSQQLPAFCGMATVLRNPVFLSCYENGNHHPPDVKRETQGLDMEAPTSYCRRAFKGNKTNGYHHHNTSLVNNSMEAENFYGSMTSSYSPCTSSITYSRFSRPLLDINASRPCLSKSLNLLNCKKQGLQAGNSLQTKNSKGRTPGIINEGKKKRSAEEMSDSATVLKKPKHENSTASSVKTHAPKVKLGDRIATLQQIVSPFGKTDTASVLLEAIGYINFLQEQVQLLCNSYVKPNSHKDPWGSLDRKHENRDMKVDLRSKGLCLFPVSCTPQVYHENTGSDYWTPTYRGCLYR